MSPLAGSPGSVGGGRGLLQPRTSLPGPGAVELGLGTATFVHRTKGTGSLLSHRLGLVRGFFLAFANWSILSFIRWLTEVLELYPNTERNHDHLNVHIYTWKITTAKKILLPGHGGISWLPWRLLSKRLPSGHVGALPPAPGGSHMTRSGQ